MNHVIFVGFILLTFQCSFILTDTRATSTTKRYDTEPSDPTSTPITTTRYDTKATSKTTSPQTKPSETTAKTTTPQTKPSETTATTHTTTKNTTTATTHKSETTAHTESTNTTAETTPTTHYTTATVQTTTVMPKPDPIEPNTYLWTAKNSNDTCFMAMAGLQFRASYNRAGEKEPFDTIFDFSNTSKVWSTNCSSSSFKVMFNQEERKQLITLSFSKTKTDYFLDMVELKFTVLASTFPNSTNLNKIVYAKSPSNVKLLKSPLGSSYSCSVETQVKFTGNETKSGISGLYMRMTDISEFQAYTNVDKKDAIKCFHDQSKPNAILGNWTASNKDGVCARLTSIMALNVGYFNVGRMLKTVQIPVEGDKAKVLSSVCTANQTMMTIDIFQDKSINLTLTFTNNEKNKNYVLSNASLVYQTTNPYFQNHEGFPMPSKLAPMSSLKLAPTPVGFSFRCDLSQDQVVVNDTGNSLSISFKSNTQWEAFGINKSGTFNEALYCPGEQSTTPSSTTQPITPHPIIPKDPAVETFEVMNKKNQTCFLADIGVQLRTKYYQTNETEKTDVGFNFMKNDTMISGSCSGDMSEVIFYSKDRQQTIAMMFSRDQTRNQTYLNQVTVMYNMTSAYFPNANGSADPKVVNVTMSGIQLFQASKDSSYKCSQERDILVDPQNSVIVRVLGIQLQAFDIKDGKYSKASQCFADTMKTTTGKTGDWFVKKDKKACARYQFASVVNITYPTLMGKDARTIFVLDNSTMNSNGFCSNVSQLSLVIDNNTFLFTFNKTDEKGGVFNYEMMDFHVHYSVKSKYFPNHAYDADGFVDLGSSNISLFQASSDHSYTCSAKVSVTFNMTNTVSFKDVKVQPFGVTESGDFSKAEDCSADKDLSPVIPIVVGAVLAFLVVLVIVAYIIGRKRARSVEYESI